MSRFIYTPNSQVGLILKGYAGTGKTSLIGALVRALDKFKLKSVLLAPTGRAAKVLSNHSGKDALTIHKKIYYQVNQKGALFFTLGKNLHKNTIFIVDEASMIGLANSGDANTRDLLDDLFRYVYNGNNCRLLFIGDQAQLPPVGNTYSPALDKEYLEGSYGISFGSIQLKEVVRQTKSSGILINATQLRIDMIQNNYDIKFSTNQEDFIAIDGYTLQDELEGEISKRGVEDVLVICRSNKRSNLYNQNIRHRILYNNEELSPGDLLMVVKNNYHWLNPQSKIGFIANGDVAEIMRIKRTEELYGCKFAEVELRLIDYPDEPSFECKIILDTLMSNSASLSYEEQQNMYKQIELDYTDIASRKKRNELIKKSPHYNALQVKFAYSITCHKSQGGQWPVVFIDQGFLPPEGINLEYLRWLYTAITRASEKVYLVNFQPQFIH